MKKITKAILLITILVVANFTVSEAMGLFSKKEGFRFENYSSAEKAQEALLKLHPVGSKAEELFNTLRNAGAECGPVKNTSYTYNLYCLYEKNVLFVFTDEWHVAIHSDKENNIEWIKLQKGLKTL